MIVLGLLILIGVVAVVVAAVARGDESAHVDLGSFDVNTDVNAVFAAGAITMLLTLIGLWLLNKGLKRWRYRRSEMRELKKRAAKGEEEARRERAASAEASESDETTVVDGDNPDARHVAGDTDEHFDTAPRER